MKKVMIGMLAGLLTLSCGWGVMAEENTANANNGDGTAAQSEDQVPPIDPSLTNIQTAYPSPDSILPPTPVPPENGMKDAEAFNKYVNEVSEYIKAAQKYIDASTNDANDVIRKRNEAVQKAQQVVDTYNGIVNASNASHKQ